jgi:uncharacterized protein YyaL (SSP411 family)
VIEPWRRQLAQVYAPRRMVLAIPEGAVGLPPALAAKAARADGVAYVCRGSVCSEPLTAWSEIAAALAHTQAP